MCVRTHSHTQSSTTVQLSLHSSLYLHLFLLYLQPYLIYLPLSLTHTLYPVFICSLSTSCHLSSLWSLFPPSLKSFSHSMFCSNIHLPQSPIVNFFFIPLSVLFSISLPPLPQYLLSSATFPFAPLPSLSLTLFCPMKAVTASVRKPFVFFPS